MSAVVLSLPENDHIANRIGAFLDLDVSSVAVHRFPDGEARVRLNRSVAGKAVVLVATLDRAAIDALQLHLPVQRHEDAHIVAAPREVARERRRNVAEPARLRERRDLGGQETHPQRHGASLPQAAARSTGKRATRPI